MSFLQISFYFFSLIMVVAAIRVVTVRNPVKAALYLVLTFFSGACIWITLEAEFLAIVLVLVYVGAVMVLFLFVVMMLDIDLEQMREGFNRFLPLSLIVGIIMIVELGVVMLSDKFSLETTPRPSGHTPEYSNTRELGQVLYTDYVYAFELAAILLLVAIVAAIALTLRRRPKTLHQSPSKQIKVKKEERLRVVSIKSEKYRETSQRDK
ncbi:MAG: NADH:ubiquinone oxidoreductase subunit J [Acidiferrobacteraceae bacterium]|jgi:NADH-quinone oxidoreductase subunit J|nr:NADH:ubiquinone oxidoreductase subunit J [Acidiferrobacteraceae bacterium]